ncbi:hypothetical protein C0583_03550 [Candidatus Parcubacteria bacterium]|nr:MAG: hypothetical protein C0583_03550 [Candidatus Parcubacteria bacterium]
MGEKLGVRKIVEAFAEDSEVSDFNEKDQDEKKEAKEGFLCLCGSRQYKSVKDNNGIMGPGGRMIVLYYYCSGCSNVFKDPAKKTESNKRILAELKKQIVEEVLKELSFRNSKSSNKGAFWDGD